MIDCPDIFKMSALSALLSIRLRAANSISIHQEQVQRHLPSPGSQGDAVNVFRHAGSSIRDVHLKLQAHIFAPSCRQRTRCEDAMFQLYVLLLTSLPLLLNCCDRDRVVVLVIVLARCGES